MALRPTAFVSCVLAMFALWFSIRMHCHTDKPRPPVPPPTVAPWSWYSEPSGPWRLPARIMGIAFADHAHAIAVTETAIMRGLAIA